MDPLITTSSDSVSDALRALTVQSSIFCTSVLRAPWGFTVEDSPVAKFHLVLSGRCVLSMPGRTPITLGAGDLVLLPGGDGHALSDGADPDAVTLEQLLTENPMDGGIMRAGGSGPLTRLLCGGFVLGTEAPSAATALLPPVLRVDAASLALSSWLEPMLHALGDQAAQGRPGTHAMQSKIAEVFLAEALRAWLIDAEQEGLLLGPLLGDEPVAAAVELLRRRFDEPWTLERVAAEVGLSRTALASRFKELVGDSPMRYLTRVRMSQAAGYLVTTRMSHFEIASLTGYATEAALSKAFKRERGETLGARRAAGRRAPEIALTA